MGNAFSLGKLFGIQFRLHYTWFIIFALVTFFLVYPDYLKWQYWLAGVITSLLFFLSVLAHELAHSLVGKAGGIPIERITLFIFGGAAEMSKEATRPSAELKMAIAGPATSLVIGALFGLPWWFIPNMPEPIAIMVWWLAVTNVVLAVFNLIPGFPLDGGRVLRSLLWLFTGSYFRSSLIAIWLGLVISFLFVMAGFFIIFWRPFELSWFNGVWIMAVGWFLGSAGWANRRQVRWQEAIRRITTSAELDS